MAASASASVATTRASAHEPSAASSASRSDGAALTTSATVGASVSGSAAKNATAAVPFGPGLDQRSEQVDLGARRRPGGPGRLAVGVGGLEGGTGRVAPGGRRRESVGGPGERVVGRLRLVRDGLAGRRRQRGPLGLDALGLGLQQLAAVGRARDGGLGVAERRVGLARRRPGRLRLLPGVRGPVARVGARAFGLVQRLRQPVEVLAGRLDLGGGGVALGGGRLGPGGVGVALACDPVERSAAGRLALSAQADLGLQLLHRLGVRPQRPGRLAHRLLEPDERRPGLLELGLAARDGRPEPLGLGRVLRHGRFQPLPLGLQACEVVRDQPQLEPAEPRRVLLVAGRLLRLPAQAAHLLLDLLDDVVQPREVAPGRVEPAEGLGAAVLVLRHAGGLLEQPAPVVGLLREDVLDHLQLDHGVRARPHAGVHEQVEHVAQPADRPVQEVLRVAVAVEPARDRHLGELGREHAARVLDRQRDLGEPERPLPLGPVEDDAGHRVAAEEPRPLLAQDPPDAVDHVRLAAPVRPDDGRDAGREVHGRLLGEALEAVEVEAAEVQTGRSRGARR